MFLDFFSSLFFNLNTLFFFFNWSFFFQLLIIYILYSIYTTTSIYYTILYTLLQIVVLGIVLTYNCMDIFTAFLFLSESVIIFISILLVFYLNVYNTTNSTIKSAYLNRLSGFIFIIFLNFFYIFYSQSEYVLYFNFDSYIFYDDFYSNKNTVLFNDLYSLYLNFFFLNNFSFICVIALLLLASLVCVNLNIVLKNNKVLNYSNFFTLFDFFKDFTKFIFMRKQTLTDQLHTPSSTRFFKRKLN
jgi:hypothetical protein